MISQDTVRLLRECDAGVRMGVESIEQVVERIRSEDFRRVLVKSRKEHEVLAEEIRRQLERCQDEGKEPAAAARGMAWMKTNAMLMMKPGDETIADLMTDGCNMGVKSLHQYLNQYQEADHASREITKKLINLEQELAVDIRSYL